MLQLSRTFHDYSITIGSRFHYDQQIKIDEIVIGPTPHIRQSQRSVFSLLVSMDLDDHDPFFNKWELFFHSISKLVI